MLLDAMIRTRGFLRSIRKKFSEKAVRAILKRLEKYAEKHPEYEAPIKAMLIMAAMSAMADRRDEDDRWLSR